MNYSGKHHHNSLLSGKATPRSSSASSCHFFDSSIRPLIILLLVLLGMNLSYHFQGTNSGALDLCTTPTMTSSLALTTTGNNTMALLSNPDTFYNTLEDLYHKYGSEIAAFRPEMRSWCMYTKSCKFTDYEVEMLYMLIREYKPQRVFEMAPNVGFSSHWILQALSKNDDTSTLHSYDIHDHSVKHMSEKFTKRWKFTLGDYQKLYDEKKIDMQQYDFIFIDALHEPDFARGYCQRLLSNHRHPNTIVAIHDIVADNLGGGRESSEVYKYLAFANNARYKFTMSPHVMPNLLYTPQAEKMVPKINKLRAKVGIVNPCDDNKKSASSCSNVLHDYLFFENNSAPTLFFQLN